MTTTFAERLKHAMNEAHMSQSELSSKTGITKASISQYLSGKNQPREDKIFLIGNAVPGTGRKFIYYINPVQFREYVGRDRFDRFFGSQTESGRRI